MNYRGILKTYARTHDVGAVASEFSLTREDAFDAITLSVSVVAAESGVSETMLNTIIHTANHKIPNLNQKDK